MFEVIICFGSGRLSLMRTVQLMKQMSDASKNIFRVYHIRIIAKKNWFTRHEAEIFLNNHCQECVRTSASMIVYLFFTRYNDRQSSEQNNRKLISLHNNGEDEKQCPRICRFLVVGNIFRLETCMNNLVKVPPYSKWIFREIFSSPKTGVILL